MRPMIPLALFWFLYFCGLGVFYPYFTLYLYENAGLSGSQVGIVLATLPLVGIVAQPFWGYVADRTGARSAVLILLTAAAAVGFASLMPMRGFAAIVAATAFLAASSATFSRTSAMVGFLA